MFGPNPTHSVNKVSDYSHRDDAFLSLYRRLSDAFQEKFDLNEYYLIFMCGSATLGIESMIRSFNKRVRTIGSEGKFKSRWEEIARKTNHSKGNEWCDLSCQLETSNSSVNVNDAELVDSVSSFPYYTIPKTSKVFTTCGNKQLGAMPGIAVVGIKKDCLEEIKVDKSFSYVNLFTHLMFMKDNQTPTTASTILFENLLDAVEEFDPIENEKKIQTNSKLLSEAFGSYVVGEKCCPVITVKREAVPLDVAKKWQLYGVNSGSKNYQFFTYNGTEQDYKNFLEDVNENS